MRRLLMRMGGWAIALVTFAWQYSCRRRIIDDPRPALRAQGRPYVFAMLHAHQIAALMLNDERPLAVMVSHSGDGELLLPSLWLRGVRAVRGSTRRAGVDKGGSHALAQLAALMGQGVPALLAVDGPRGPRGHVHRGIVALAQQCGAVILPVVGHAPRAFRLMRAWDRLELPRPWTTLTLRFAPPIIVGRDDGEQHVRKQIAGALAQLEAQDVPP